MIWLETPSNPMLKVIDIEGVRAICNAAAKITRAPSGVADKTLGPLGTGIKGPVLVVDNTFASPWLQNPLRQAAHAVMHSCTKYVGGHSRPWSPAR
jgi:cystathionine beta-lyase/cystathionine gamma-synthase